MLIKSLENLRVASHGARIFPLPFVSSITFLYDCRKTPKDYFEGYSRKIIAKFPKLAWRAVTDAKLVSLTMQRSSPLCPTKLTIAGNSSA